MRLAIANGIRHPAAHLTHWLGYLGKESEIEGTGAFIDQIAKNGDQRRHHQDSGAHRSNGGQVIGEDPPQAVGGSSA
jgi:hypothetical protein